MHVAALACVKRVVSSTQFLKPFLQLRGAVVDEIYIVQEYNCLRYVLRCGTLHGTAKNEIQVDKSRDFVLLDRLNDNGNSGRSTDVRIMCMPLSFIPTCFFIASRVVGSRVAEHA